MCEETQKCEEVAIKKVEAKQKESERAADDFNVGMAQLVAKQKAILAKVNGLVNSKRNSLSQLQGFKESYQKDANLFSSTGWHAWRQPHG